MERASRVMYTIANVFTWIIALSSIVGIVFSILRMTGVVSPIEGIEFFGTGSLIYLIVVLLVSLLTIWMVRKAKGKNTSKGWDVLFFVLGILGGNIFYILGGIFGIVAVRK